MKWHTHDRHTWHTWHMNIYIYIYIWGCVKIRVWIGPRWSRRMERSGSPAFWYGSGVWIGLWVQGMDRGFTFWLAAIYSYGLYIYNNIYIYIHVALQFYILSSRFINCFWSSHRHGHRWSSSPRIWLKSMVAMACWICITVLSREGPVPDLKKSEDIQYTMNIYIYKL